MHLCSTFFYIGYLPFAPGSIASLVAVFISYLLHNSTILYVLVLVAITILGFTVSGRMEQLVGQKDPSCVVIDEVAGGMIAFFLLPKTTAVTVTAYFLFRAFDMFKIYPVNKLEELQGGKGIMVDDLFAGLYTNIVVQIALRLAGVV